MATRLWYPPWTFELFSGGATIYALPNVWHIVDTSSGLPVTVVLPSGLDVGCRICIQNAPANGYQMGGTNPGATITIEASNGETIEGASSVTLGAPTSSTQTKGPAFYPTGAFAAESGFGAGWLHN